MSGLQTRVRPGNGDEGEWGRGRAAVTDVCNGSHWVLISFTARFVLTASTNLSGSLSLQTTLQDLAGHLKLLLEEKKIALNKRLFKTVKPRSHKPL